MSNSRQLSECSSFIEELFDRGAGIGTDRNLKNLDDTSTFGFDAPRLVNDPGRTPPEFGNDLESLENCSGVHAAPWA